MEWMTIDSAPKDGSPIILGTTGGWVAEGRYEGGSDFVVDDVCGWYLAYANPGDGHESGKNVQPTHWMHLPEPPKQNGE